jgi:putative Flp pilus-assembly TadE/G-like protein
MEQRPTPPAADHRPPAAPATRDGEYVVPCLAAREQSPPSQRDASIRAPAGRFPETGAMLLRIRHWWAGGRAPAEGQALVLFALLFPVLAGIAGLALDGGNLYFQRRALQSIADAAAITGAQVANFNADAPQILPDGVNQARLNAVANGAVVGEITVNLPPSAGTAWAGRPDYIEVIITRPVPNAFMGLFGQHTSTVSARAVARCNKPGYGEPAILALSDDPDAITFNGGGSSAVRVVGDIVSNGGIDPNGNASHFQIDGAAYALTQPAPANLTTTNGIYGSTSGTPLLPVADPIAQGANAVPPTVVWPDWAALPTGSVRICDDTWPPASGSTCNDGTSVDTRSGSSGSITTGSGKYAIFTPGSYHNVTIKGHARFKSGVYSFGTLDLGANGDLTDNGAGVLIRVTSASSSAANVGGGIEFHLSALQPNTWMDIVLYAPNGGVDVNGNGERQLDGSVYAPNGPVEIAGSAGHATVNGQIIADTVNFSGNGPAVNYIGPSGAGTFGPILVNTPD